MCRAIVECHRVDEVRDMKDKARALEVYAMQIRNTEAERTACNIRLRAERRLGELLKELARTLPPERGLRAHSSSPNGAENSPYARALTDNDISTQSASRYQRLADIPTEEFEHALADPLEKPSTTGLIRAIRDPVPRLDERSLWIWGFLCDFERYRATLVDPHALWEGMTDTMQADARRIAPALVAYLGAFIEAKP